MLTKYMKKAPPVYSKSDNFAAVKLYKNSNEKLSVSTQVKSLNKSAYQKNTLYHWLSKDW